MRRASERWRSSQWKDICAVIHRPTEETHIHTAFSPEEPDHTLPNQDNGQISTLSDLDEKTAWGCLVSQFEQE